MCSLKTWDRVKLSLHGHLLECACSYEFNKEVGNSDKVF